MAASQIRQPFGRLAGAWSLPGQLSPVRIQQASHRIHRRRLRRRPPRSDPSPWQPLSSPPRPGKKDPRKTRGIEGAAAVLVGLAAGEEGAWPPGKKGPAQEEGAGEEGATREEGAAWPSPSPLSPRKRRRGVRGRRAVEMPDGSSTIYFGVPLSSTGFWLAWLALPLEALQCPDGSQSGFGWPDGWPVGASLRMQKLCYLCMALCWILTALFWMYFGLYYFFDKFAGDTCAALDEYQLNPQNSTLGSIIPCSEKLSGGIILHDVGAGIHDIIDQVNSNIYTIKSEYPVKRLDYIGNPFTDPPAYQYRPQNCPSGAVTIGDIPQILKRLTCSDFGGGPSCRPADLSSAIDYDKVQSYTSSIQNVLDIFPGTERLVSCELVKAGFADIVGGQCAPLRRGARAARAALAALSAAMALLLMLLLLELTAARRHPGPGDDRLSVRHLTSATNSEISEAEFAEMHAKKVRIRVAGP